MWQLDFTNNGNIIFKCSNTTEDCGISNAKTLEIPQSCTKPSRLSQGKIETQINMQIIRIYPSPHSRNPVYPQ